tara:strand:+ start:4401 stop:5186 length:786 start_codon:yes stop_codon:yes gene_type:complete
MPVAIQSAIQSMCEDAIGQAIAALSDKYGFDKAEAQRELNLSKMVIKAPGKLATKTKTEKSDKPKTKRGPTGYLLFSKDVRPDTKAELQAEVSEGEKLKPQDIISAIGAKWKALSDEEKAVWNAKAKESVDSDEKSTVASSEDEAPPPKPVEEPKEKLKEKPKEKPKEKSKATKAKVKEEEPSTSTAPVEKKKKANGYLLFAKDNRASIKAQLEEELDEGEKLQPAKVVSAVAAAWKKLSESEKEEWNLKAGTPPSSDDSD